ncbi:MAG TPA: hypothetical protein VK666_24680 [Chryseolinea sp.]|nr:hypothetical protein [Chryseolinea sp.]
MKTNIKSRELLSPYSEPGFLISFIIITLFGLALASCGSDDEPTEPDTRPQFVGEYAVEEVNPTTSAEYAYDITIVNGANGDLEISNFGDVFNVPVKATVKGTALTIKSQTFNGSGGHTATVSGSGTLSGNTLTFTYTVTGSADYSGNCIATKK